MPPTIVVDPVETTITRSKLSTEEVLLMFENGSIACLNFSA